VTFWGPAAIKDIRRYSCSSAIQLKGAVVISREGRFGLKATPVTDIEVFFKFKFKIVFPFLHAFQILYVFSIRLIPKLMKPNS
jgi:hypothetical protein